MVVRTGLVHQARFTSSGNMWLRQAGADCADLTVGAAIEGAEMIVWLASYPRSGNTFLRIALHRLFGVSSAVVYDRDGVAVRLGAESIPTSASEPLGMMRASGDVYWVKTHRPFGHDVGPGDRAICVLRDGRDAAVSWARQLTEQEPAAFTAVLAELIDFPERRGTSSWGANALSWMDAPVDIQRAFVTFDELISDPRRAVVGAAEHLGLTLGQGPADALIPRFEDLQQLDPLFFRRGRVGTFREEMPAELTARFMARPDNAAALRRLDERLFTHVSL